MNEFTILKAGTMVAGRFLIRKVLGKGGMGAVYEAEDVISTTTVALKALREDLYAREDLVKRFEREARSAARIGHPNIVGVLAVGHDDELRTRFIVQECLFGTDVSGCLNELGSFSALSALAVTLPIMDALTAAHAVGIIHRDIKPENVFLHESADGTIVPKVIDFGIAKVIDELDRIERTATGTVFGTPWYMSPEQAMGDSSIDARTDIWSVGAMLYEMLCGTLPFGGTNPNAVMAQIIFGEPTPLRHHWPDAPADLVAVVHRAIERDLDKRFATMAEFRAALAGCSIWTGITPENARDYLPRPSSFEGIDDLLPADFVDGSNDDSSSGHRPRRRSQRSAMSLVPLLPVLLDPPPSAPDAPIEAAPLEARSAKPSLDERAPSTRPASPAINAAPLATDLDSSVSQRRQRLTFGEPPPSSHARFRVLGFSLGLFCGAALLAIALTRWTAHPEPRTLTASLPSSAAYVLPAALSRAAEPPREIPEVRAPRSARNEHHQLP